MEGVACMTSDEVRLAQIDAAHADVDAAYHRYVAALAANDAYQTGDAAADMTRAINELNRLCTAFR
jgi:hypothetical protein